MQGREISTHDVVALFDARRNGEVENTLVLDEVVGGPGVAAGVEALLGDLEPVETRDILLRG